MVETGKPLAYTVDQAAALLNISRRKLTYLIAFKEIRSFQVGKKGKKKSRRISAEALQEFIKKSEQAAR